MSCPHSSRKVWVNATALPCVKCTKRCWIRCIVRCDISIFWFPVTRGKMFRILHMSELVWTTTKTGQESAWTYTPKTSSKAMSLAVQLLDNNCVSDTLFCLSFETTKLIIKNNSCKDCSSLPTERLRSFGCDRPFSLAWKQLEAARGNNTGSILNLVV